MISLPEYRYSVVPKLVARLASVELVMPIVFIEPMDALTTSWGYEKKSTYVNEEISTTHCLIVYKLKGSP